MSVKAEKVLNVASRYNYSSRLFTTRRNSCPIFTLTPCCWMCINNVRSHIIQEDEEKDYEIKEFF